MADSMFARINIRADAQTGELDLGFLAECLIFYDCVFVLGGPGDLIRLITAATPSGLTKLFKTGSLRFLLHPVTSAVQTLDKGTGLERHDLIFFTKVDQLSKKSIPISKIVSNCVDDDSIANIWLKAPNRFIRQSGIQTIDLPTARKQLWNERLLSSLMTHWLHVILPDEVHLHEIKLKSWELTKALQVSSEADFCEISDSLKRTYGTDDRFDDLNFAHFLSFIFDAYTDLHFAAHTNADVAKTSFGAPFLELLSMHSLRATEQRLGEIHTFQHHVLNNAAAIREAINSGEKLFADIIPIVEKSRHFKKWLARRDPDISLVSAYLTDVTKKTWTEGLPSKTLRWLSTSAVSKVADATLGAGLLVEIFDTVVVDRILKGWRPNQFIDGSLKKFLPD